MDMQRVDQNVVLLWLKPLRMITDPAAHESCWAVKDGKIAAFARRASTLEMHSRTVERTY
jgi:hypothetical protein